MDNLGDLGGARGSAGRLVLTPIGAPDALEILFLPSPRPFCCCSRPNSRRLLLSASCRLSLLLLLSLGTRIVG